MFDLLAHTHHTMLSNKLPSPPSCRFASDGFDKVTDENGLEYLCFDKKRFTGVTQEASTKGKLAVNVWFKGLPINEISVGLGAKAGQYENCPLTVAPNHRAFELSPPCTYISPSSVPAATENVVMTWD